MYIVAVAIPGVSLFLLFPLWQIEHPADPSLIIRSERHLLWNRPAHAHVDPIAMVIPVLAILIVTAALFVVALRND